MESQFGNPFGADRCCICGGPLKDGHAVLLTDEQGNEARIDRACCDAITALAKSEDRARIREAIAYMRSYVDSVHPSVKRKLEGYIRKGQERLRPEGDTRPAGAARPATPRPSAQKSGESFPAKALAIIVSIASILKVIFTAIFDVVKRFFTEDPKKINIGKFAVGLRTLIAAGLAVVILLLIIIIPGGSGGIVGEWKIYAISYGGQTMDIEMMSMMGVDIDMTMEFHKNGDLTLEAAQGLLGGSGTSETGKWSVSGDELTIIADGEESTVTYKIEDDKLYMNVEEGTQLIMSR